MLIESNAILNRKYSDFKISQQISTIVLIYSAFESFFVLVCNILNSDKEII
jgi:hypothetical protein